MLSGELPPNLERIKDSDLQRTYGEPGSDPACLTDPRVSVYTFLGVRGPREKSASLPLTFRGPAGHSDSIVNRQHRPAPNAY